MLYEVITEYRFLGFEDVVINKENSVMIKNGDAYILATLKGYDLTIETFKTNLPSIINTNINLFVQDSVITSYSIHYTKLYDSILAELLKSEIINKQEQNKLYTLLKNNQKSYNFV